MRKRLILAGVAAACLVLFAATPRDSRAGQTSVVTFYWPTGSPTYSGEWPYWGSAGASWNIPLGSVVRLHDGHVVTINDRGALPANGPYWIDAHCPWEYADYCRANYGYGPYEVEFLRWGY